MSNVQGDLIGIFGDAGFDTASVEPQGDFPVYPPNKYLCLIERACVKPTKTRTGYGIEIELMIQEDEFKNHKLWDWINIENSNAQCVEIGLRQAAALGQACGIPALKDSAQLVNQFVIAHVIVKNNQNEIRTYSAPKQQVEEVTTSMPMHSVGPQAAPVATPCLPGQGQQSSAPTVPPWAR